MKEARKRLAAVPTSARGSFAASTPRFLQRCGGVECPAGTCNHGDEGPKLLGSREGLGPQYAPPIVHEVVRSSGRPLDPAVRTNAEAFFGQDFSRVRIHTGSRATRSAEAVNAL